MGYCGVLSFGLSRKALIARRTLLSIVSVIPGRGGIKCGSRGDVRVWLESVLV